MKIFKKFFLVFSFYPLLAAFVWASGEMMPSAGTTMMDGGGMMSGDSMTRMMSKDLGNRQMMGNGMQNMDMKHDMENMQKNQAGGEMKGSMPQSQASMNQMTGGEMQGMMGFHMARASECEKSAEVAQATVTYYEQMKRNDEEMMGKVPKESQLDTYKNMMRHYDAAITNAARLKKDFEEMGKWHKAQVRKLKEMEKKVDEGKKIK